MLNQILRAAPRSAVLRIARAQPSEWSMMTVSNDGNCRNFVGHLEDWAMSVIDFKIEPREKVLEDLQRLQAQSRFLNMANRYGLMRTVEMLRASAKRALGRKE